MLKAWSDLAWEDFVALFNLDKKYLKKVLKLIDDIDRNGNTGLGKPEALTGNLSGYWSRRIDAKNRLVYKIENNMIIIAQCGTHYGDK